MVKMKGFEAEVVEGSLWLVKSMAHTSTGHMPVCMFEVRVRIGENGVDHSVDARVVSLTSGTETIWDRKTSICATLDDMEKEALKLKEWGLNWQDKKKMKAFKDMVSRCAKPARA